MHRRLKPRGVLRYALFSNSEGGRVQMTIGKQTHKSFSMRWRRNWSTYKSVYLLLIPLLAYYIIFHYIPMGGTVIAFQNYKPALGLTRSKWVGLKHFVTFFKGPYAWRVIRNTLVMNALQILFAFPAPIIFALLLNELGCKRYQRCIQTVSYMPHFVSLVVICGILTDFTLTDGLINDLIALLGGERSNLLNRPELFRTVYVASGIWQNAGWGSIIYLATLTNVDPALHEAAAIDGARELTILFRIILPVSTSTVAVIALFYAVGHWNSWFNAMLYLQNRALYPLQLFLREALISNSPTGAIEDPDSETLYIEEVIRNATIIVSTLPILCAYPFVQRYFVTGVMLGSIKE